MPSVYDLLAHQVATRPDALALEDVTGTRLTYAQLSAAADEIAAVLKAKGIAQGDRVMIAYPFGLEFLAGMLGAMKVGVTPCSIYPPNPNELKTSVNKFRGFVEDAGAKIALSTTTFSSAMKAAGLFFKNGVTWIGTDKLSTKKGSSKATLKKGNGRVANPDGIAFIQYTSGSTGRPKGVEISHRNLVENCRAVGLMSDVEATTVAALWVPQYHGEQIKDAY